MRFAWRRKASLMLPVRTYSSRSARSTIRTWRTSRLGPKYARTRSRRTSALPTYRTRPLPSLKRYTPGAPGNEATCASSDSRRDPRSMSSSIPTERTVMLSLCRGGVGSRKRGDGRCEASAEVRAVGGPSARPPRGPGRRGRRGRDHGPRGTDRAPCEHGPPAARDAAPSRVCPPEPRHQPLPRRREARDARGRPLALRRDAAAGPANPPRAHRGHARDGEPRRARRHAGRLHRDGALAPGRPALHERGHSRPAPRDRRRQGPARRAASPAARHAPRPPRAARLHGAHAGRPAGAAARARRGPRPRVLDRRRGVRRRRALRRHRGRPGRRAGRGPLDLRALEPPLAPALWRDRAAPAARRRGARRCAPRSGGGRVLTATATIRAGLRGEALARGLVDVLGRGKVVATRQDMLTYEYDGSADTASPDAVVLPETTTDVAAVARFCHEHGVPIVPRGAGTGLSGGAIPVEGGVVMSFARMARILEIDVPNLRAVVQPGVVNLHLSTAVAPHGLYFVPDPSSQKACTLGGNVAENSGGPHTLAYGVTTNHVTGLEIVLSDGTIARLGGKAVEDEGYDLVGTFVGSEGTLRMVTEITVKLTPLAEDRRTVLAAFTTMDQASETVSAIIASGVVPAGIEMMANLATQAVEEAVPAGYPLDAGGILLVEVDGVRDGLEDPRERIEAICRANGASSLRLAATALEREKLWAGRKGAFAAMGRLAPDYYVQDGVIPRTRLPEILRRVNEAAASRGLRIANVFHAGDGNLHPLIVFDLRKEPDALRRAQEAGLEILAACVEAGGSITGEHGVGMEKNCFMPLQFRPDDLAAMRRVKDAFDPAGLANPGKVFPTPSRCREFSLGAVR